MSKNIVFCFDGTCNDPEDADQEEMQNGGVKDSSITNVLKLHLLFGGNFKNVDYSAGSSQISLYYSGVGTYGGNFKRAFNMLLAPDNLDVRDIVNDGLADFKQYYKSGDRIFVFGFSRGAAIARRFCAVLEDKFENPDIRFVGVFDTVAAIGLPNLNSREKPASDVVFENGHSIAGNIEEALHIVALDEKRKAFRPTLMNYEDRVTEVWFAGAHADVGGGYHRDGLSDVTLRYMLDELEGRNLGLEIFPPSKVDYNNLLPAKAGYGVDFNDVIIEPDIFGKNHQQRRFPLTAALTLDDRELRVNEGDMKSERLPVIYYSAAERIYGDRDYRPKSLKGIKHQVVYSDGSLMDYTGLQHHQHIGMRPMKALKEGETVDVPIFAYKKYNHTGLMLQKGVEYDFTVKGEQKWKDGGIFCGADGWDRDGEELGFVEFLIAGMEPFRRCADADWFALVGCISCNDNNTFIIGTSLSYTPDCNGEFSPFANDLDRFYGNNSGKLIVTVKRK